MSVLDDLIAAVAPRYALERARARLALDGLRDYEAGRPDSRRVEGWRRRDGGPVSEIDKGGPRVRALVRDLLRNNGYAQKAHRKLVSATIGTGITGTLLNAEGRPANRQLRDAWARFVDGCDFNGQLDLYGLQTLVARAQFGDGDVLVRRYRNADAFAGTSSRPPFQFQVLEIDYLDTAKSDLAGISADRNWIDRGIEYDPQGRKVAYWLHQDHPGNQTPYLRSRYESIRVPVEDCWQVYDVLRPGQDRGISIFSAAVLPLNDLAGYLQREAMRKSIEAALAVFITSPEDPNAGGLALGVGGGDGAATTDAAGNGLTRIVPGMVTRLKPGEDVSPGPVAPVGDMTPFVQQMAFLAAAGAGVMYEHATGDFRNVNYSSYRVGSHDFGQMIEALQWQLYVPRLCRPMAASFLEGARALTVPGAGSAAVRWTPPNPVTSPDPMKDALADAERMRQLVMAPSEVAEARGWNYGELLERYAADLATADTALPPGSRSNTDPRNPVAGAAAPVTQEAPPNAGN